MSGVGADALLLHHHFQPVVQPAHHDGAHRPHRGDVLAFALAPIEAALDGFGHRHALRQREPDRGVDADRRDRSLPRSPGCRRPSPGSSRSCCGARPSKRIGLVENGGRIPVEPRIGLDGQPAVLSACASKIGLSSVAALADISSTMRQPISSSVAVGHSCTEPTDPGFHAGHFLFQDRHGMTGLQVAPTAPCSSECVSSSMDAESFHRHVGVVWVIS